MAKKSGLVSVGWFFSLFGAILMIIFGIYSIVKEFLPEIENLSSITVNFLPDDANVRIVGAIITILLGLVIIWIWKEKKFSKNSDLPILGILLIIFGLISGLSLAGLMVVVGGALFLIEYYF